MRKVRKSRARTRKGWPALKSILPRGKRERRRIELLSGAAVGVFIALSLGVFWASNLQQQLLRSPNVAAVISAVLMELANGDRAQNGLGQLTINPVLVEAAQAKANDMASRGYFAHTSPEGVDPWHWFEEAGYSFAYAGENLAMDFSDSSDVNTAWMNSPTHRGNILDPHFTEIGIATAQGMYQGRLTTFVVQEFGAPAGTRSQQPVASASVPKNPATVAIATTEPNELIVLGSTSEKPAASAPTTAKPPTPITTVSPAVAASLARETQGQGIPLWGYLVGFPRTAMHYAYYVIGLLIILGLIIDTGLELHVRHRKKALHASMALAIVCVCFILADAIFFATPVLAALPAALGG